MTDIKTETYPVRLQAAVYGTGFFNGTTQSMATQIVVLLLLGYISSESQGFLVGIILASRQFLTVTMSVYSGGLMDRFGTRRIILVFGVSGVLAAISYPILGPMLGLTFDQENASHPGWSFLAGILVIQMISGWSEATTWIGSQSLVGQLMKGHPIYAGRMTFVARVGGFLGPPTIGKAWDLFGSWGAFGFLALWIVGGMIAGAFLPDAKPAYNSPSPPKTDIPPQTAKPHGDYATTFRLLLIPAIAMVIMITVMRQTGSGVQSSFYIVWLREVIQLSGVEIGFLIGGANAASAVAALGMGPLTHRYAAHWLLILMIGLSIVAIAITPVFGTEYSVLLYVALMVAICFRGIGQGLNLPLMMMIMARNVGADLQARITALRITFNRFGGMTIPPIMGGLADIVGLGNSFYIIGSVGVTALCALSIWVARSPSFKNT